MHLQTENRIIGHLLKTPFEAKNLHQIAAEIKASYITVHTSAPILVKHKVIKIHKQGKAHLTSIDFDHAPLERLTSAMLSEKENYCKRNPAFTLLVRNIEENMADLFYILVLFGSYARGDQKKKSDVDLLFIIPTSENEQEYQEKINKILKLHTLPIDFKIATLQDFKEMLDERYTVGRSILQQSIILFGIDQYYAMVKSYVRSKGY